MSQDERHLNLLSTFHYVVAAITGLFACFPICHFGMGIAMMVAALRDPGDGAPPALFGLAFSGIAAGIIAIGWVLVACMALAGYYLGRRKHYRFCMVVAGVECLVMPYGTVLGVLTLIALVRPSAEVLFEQDGRE